MAVKLADTLAPMGDFPALMAEHLNIVKDQDTGEEKSLQKMYEDGELGGGGTDIPISADEGNIFEKHTDGYYAREQAIDDALSETSENPVQNKIVKEAIDGAIDEAKKGYLNAAYDDTDKILTLTGDEDPSTANENIDELDILVGGTTYKFKGGEGGASKAEDVSYEYDTHPDWDNVKKALDGLIEKVEYVAPSVSSFTMTPSATEYEVGQSVSSLTFAWTYNKNVKTQTLTDVSLADATVRTGTWTGTLTSNKTFTLSASDGTKSATASKSISFKHKIYWGSAAEASNYDSAFILGLSDKKFATDYKGRLAVTVKANEYAFVACPSTWKIPESTYIGGFLTDLTKVATISFTNASGGVTNYDILRTGRSGLGAIEMEFK